MTIARSARDRLTSLDLYRNEGKDGIGLPPCSGLRLARVDLVDLGNCNL